jgi:hypothetical protein
MTQGFHTRQTLARRSRSLFPSWPVRLRAKWVRSLLILGEKALTHPARRIKRNGK